MTVTETVAPPRALAHPLPAGMRDLLPEEARRRRALVERALGHFALHGYELVTPPAFELADVLERGLGALDPADVLRFVEPESGEVAALRPDMTPQIARIVATRLARDPLPIRLSYEGAVLRRRQGRARRHRQVAQAGVELCGAPGLGGDLEMLAVAASTLRSLGLVDAVIDVGHAAVTRALLAPLPSALAAEVSDALGQKDGARIERLLRDKPSGGTLAALSELHGGGPGDVSGVAILDRARTLLAGGPAEAPLRELERLWTSAVSMTIDGGVELGPALRLDLGEARGFAYYTGMTFHVLAAGPGEAIGAGGRYDDLLARFDAPMPAIGFALNLDSVAWAREAAGVRDAIEPRVVVAVRVDDAAALAGANAAVTALRAASIAAVVHDVGLAPSFARAARFTHVVELDAGGGFRAHALEDEGSRVVRDLDALAHLLRAG